MALNPSLLELPAHNPKLLPPPIVQPGMKRTTLLATLILLLTTTLTSARPVRIWTYQELTTASDLVVIATCTATADTKEEVNLPEMPSLRVTGVETKFTILTVFKGDAKLKDLTLHHYRLTKNDIPIVNGPMFANFDPKDTKPCLLFLIRQPDGRYTPTGGQVDPMLNAIHPFTGNSIGRG